MCLFFWVQYGPTYRSAGNEKVGEMALLRLAAATSDDIPEATRLEVFIPGRPQLALDAACPRSEGKAIAVVKAAVHRLDVCRTYHQSFALGRGKLRLGQSGGVEPIGIGKIDIRYV